MKSEPSTGTVAPTHLGSSVPDVDPHGTDFIGELVSEVVEFFPATGAVLAFLEPGVEHTVRTHFFLLRGEQLAEVCYDLLGTPCENVVLEGASAVYPDGIQDQFPDDSMLVECGLHAYVGAPVHGSDGRVEGVVAVFFETPLEDGDRVRTILEFLAARISAEVGRRTSEMALATSRRRTRQILESVGEGIVGVDGDGRILFHNPAASRILRWEGDMVGREVHRVLGRHGLDGKPRSEDRSPFRQTLIDGSIRRVDHECFRAPGGPLVPVEYICAPLQNSAEEVVGAVVSFSDISERRRNEGLQSMERSVLAAISQDRPLNEVLDVLVSGLDSLSPEITASVMLVDQKTGQLRTGPAPRLPKEYLEAVDGVFFGEGVGSCGTAVFRGESVFTEDIDEDPLWEDYRELTRAHGLRACWSVPVIDGRGVVLCTFALYSRVPARPRDRDLDVLTRATHLLRIAMERTRRREELEASQERFRLLAHATNDAILDWDLESGTLWWNEGFRTLVGRDQGGGETDVDSWLERIHPEDRGPVISGLEQAMEEGRERWSSEYRFQRDDGTYAFVLDRCHLIYDEGRKATRVIGGITDLTERRELERQLLESQKLESVGRLAGGVAHDFNNLLSVILGTVDLTLDAMSRDAEHREEFQTIRKAADQAGRLTRNLLAFSRRQVMRPEALDLNSLVDETLDLLRRLLTETIQVSFQPATNPLRVFVDRAQLEQVIVNLVLNARDAMPRGGRLELKTALTRVEARSQEETGVPEGLPTGAYALLTVEDTGMGVDPELLDQIFEPFFTTKETGRGTGLGLATVYGIVQQSGGRIEVSSEVGVGSIFRILLPVQTGPDPATPSLGPGAY
jgi:PAS domain S-box-containing protein